MHIRICIFLNTCRRTLGHHIFQYTSHLANHYRSIVFYMSCRKSALWVLVLWVQELWVLVLWVLVLWVLVLWVQALWVLVLWVLVLWVLVLWVLVSDAEWVLAWASC